MGKKASSAMFFVIAILLSILAGGTAEAQGVINLPQTGQTTCYDSSGGDISCGGTGQDGEHRTGVEWPNPRFTNPDGTTPITGAEVLDRLTGLVWMRDGSTPKIGSCSGGLEIWQWALDYAGCLNSINYLGHNDWRLPNINELESLVNSEETDIATWLNTEGFVNVQANYYWSSTTYAYMTPTAWTVYMWNGDVMGGFVFKAFEGCYVWPLRSGQLNNSDPLFPANVWETGQISSYATGDDGELKRGVSWPTPRFTDHGDSTVTDNLTGLMWAKNANLLNGVRTWQGALDYVKALNTGSGLAGYHDWHLPNRKELLSLIDHERFNPPLPAGYPFQNVQPIYWSSTTIAHYSNYAWIMAMAQSGDVFSVSKSDSYYVWPVRSAQVSQFQINPTEGTIGTEVTVDGTGFGGSKGKILIGNVALKVVTWADTEIKASLKKAMLPGSYGVTVQPKAKGSQPIFKDNFFEIKGPKIDTIDPPTGRVKDTITIKGRFFGSKKGKVYLNGKSCKVTNWVMNPGEEFDDIVFVVPKGITGGTYPLKVTNSVGEDTGEFEVVP